MQLQRVAVFGAALFGLTAAAPASADILFLTTGRTLSVKSHRIEGRTIVVSLRGGGAAAFDASLVQRVAPDEVPYPEPVVPGPSAPVWSAALERVPYADLIDSLAAAHGVDAGLVKALIQVESGYRVRARSPKGAMGLMQLMPRTARQYSVRNPYDPKANLDAGIRHLASLLSRFEVSVALAAYNAGEAAVRRFGGVPPYRETRNYVKRILAMVTPSSN